MPFIVRRVFFGKPGMADPLVDHLKEGHRLFEQHGATWKTRVLTDYLSGRSDRVASEWEAESIGQIEVAMAGLMNNPGVRNQLSDWESRLQGMIEYTEVETWSVR